jgi:ubiquinone/menaquinone biosynthesis C-methylase UbiE
MLFRQYAPPDPKRLHVHHFGDAAPNRQELANMNETVMRILDSMTVDEYFAARGGIDAFANYVDHVIRRTSLEPSGRVLEFGAGTAKVSAVLSRFPEVTEVVANDFSEPLLTEIAPRVINRLNGDLDKFTFLVGDMNGIPELDDRFDLIVCYYAIHHLVLPEHFLNRIAQVLAPEGRIVCFREPAMPRIELPTRSLRAARAALRRKRLDGENENLYTVAEYDRMTPDSLAFGLVAVHDGARFRPEALQQLATAVTRRPFDIAYVLNRR